MNFEYVKEYYQVPAAIGMGVDVNGRAGVIIADRGNYIGVNFDDTNPGDVSNCHPTWRCMYTGMRPIRKPTKSQERYQRYLEYGEGFDSFIDYCRWDADPERSWNKSATKRILR